VFGKQFNKDIEKLSKQYLALLLQIVSEVEEAKSIEDIPCRKLAGGAKRAYRIRMGDYRITFILFVFDEKTIGFQRILIRGEAYNKEHMRQLLLQEKQAKKNY
jgi:mRNA-degrading endonuclease RelE of RelBE toxin-antitoxin system